MHAELRCHHTHTHKGTWEAFVITKRLHLLSICMPLLLSLTVLIRACILIVRALKYSLAANSVRLVIQLTEIKKLELGSLSFIAIVVVSFEILMDDASWTKLIA